MATETRPLPAPDKDGPEPKPKTPEKLQYREGKIGLQARMLLGGEAINPAKKDLPIVTPDSLGSFEQRDYDVFYNASANERMQHWQGKEASFDAQKRAWVQSTVTVFDNAQNFFQKNQEGKQWKALFEKLGIQTDQFTQVQAESLYTKYFGAENAEENVKKFVKDVVETYKKNGAIDYEGLKRDMGGVEWLANIFGNTSSEVIGQLVDAEARLNDPGKKEAFIQQVNATEETPQGEILRLNKLDDHEERLLTFLWEGRTVSPVVTPPQPPTDHPRVPQGYKWHYDRAAPGEKRIPPLADIQQEMLDPRFIANKLKIVHQRQYGSVSEEDLAKQIQGEQEQLRQKLDASGLTKEQLAAIATRVLGPYKESLKTAYGLTIPDIGDFTIAPVSGNTASLYNPEGTSTAYVDSRYPIIFLDMDRITEIAKELGVTRTSWETLNQDQLHMFLEPLLAHEYTHLIGDLAFWRLVKEGKNGEETIDIDPAKRGITVSRPMEVTAGQPPGIAIRDRGKWLSEAITTEVSHKGIPHVDKRVDERMYTHERHVLNELVNLLASNQHITKDEAFKKFVLGYFSPGEKRMVWNKKKNQDEQKNIWPHFANLVKELSFPKEENGKITYQKPHLLSAVYALMQYEHAKADRQNRPADYPLTLAYIRGTLSQTQKDEFLQNMASLETSPKVKDYLQKILSGQPIPPPAHRPWEKDTPAPVEKRPSAKNIADNLLNYETGVVNEQQFDLSQEFPHLVNQVRSRIENADPLFKENVTVVLSDVAGEMIKKIASEANRKNKELSFVLQGVWIDHNGKRVLVAAYAVPAMDYTKARPVNTDIVSEVHMQNAIKLAQKTNLETYFTKSTTFNTEDSGAICHVHHEQLGEQWRATPSQGDYAQIEQYLRDTPAIPRTWGVATLAENKLFMTLFDSEMQNGQPQHRQIPFVMSTS